MTRVVQWNARRPRRGGFTLIELVVVLAIGAVALAVVLPGYQPRGQSAVDAGAALESALLRSRGLALKRASPVQFVLQSSSGHWFTLAAYDTLLAGDLPLGPMTRVEGGDDGWVVVRFDARGRARGGPVTLTDIGTRHAVVISPWTGTARRRATALQP